MNGSRDINEQRKFLSTLAEVAEAFARAPDIGAKFHVDMKDLYFSAGIHLKNYDFWSQKNRDREESDKLVLTIRDQDARIRAAVRKAREILGETKIFRSEYGFDMLYKNLKITLWDYPTKYSVSCERVCYVVGNGKKIPIRLDEEIDIDTEEATDALKNGSPDAPAQGA